VTTKIHSIPQPATIGVEHVSLAEFGKRIALPDSKLPWLKKQTWATARDRLPHLTFAGVVVVRWGSREVEEWILRRSSGGAR
jgi:hypothetical protein